MDNKTINPNYTCDGCFYIDLYGTDEPCCSCARNNLSGYYEDEYVDVEVTNEIYLDCLKVVRYE